MEAAMLGEWSNGLWNIKSEVSENSKALYVSGEKNIASNSPPEKNQKKPEIIRKLTEILKTEFEKITEEISKIEKKIGSDKTKQTQKKNRDEKIDYNHEESMDKNLKEELTKLSLLKDQTAMRLSNLTKDTMESYNSFNNIEAHLDYHATLILNQNRLEKKLKSKIKKLEANINELKSQLEDLKKKQQCVNDESVVMDGVHDAFRYIWDNVSSQCNMEIQPMIYLKYCDELDLVQRKITESKFLPDKSYWKGVKDMILSVKPTLTQMGLNIEKLRKVSVINDGRNAERHQFYFKLSKDSWYFDMEQFQQLLLKDLKDLELKNALEDAQLLVTTLRSFTQTKN